MATINPNFKVKNLLEVQGTGVSTLAGQLQLPSVVITTGSAVGGATFRVPHGVAPTAPVDGDMWTTLAGLFTRVNGVSVQFATTAFVVSRIAADATPLSHVGSGGTSHATVIPGGNAGFMSGADKTKLDGIATGATNSSGTVTSVQGFGTVSGLTLTGTVTSAGSLTLGGTLAVAPTNFASQTASSVLIAPASANGIPTFRTIELSDILDAWTLKSARVATTANITLSGTQTIDTVAVVAGDRVLVKDQTAASQNGVYTVAAGAWTRVPDANTSARAAGGAINVDSGTQGGQLYTTSFKSTDTLGTTAMSWWRVIDTSLAGNVVGVAAGVAGIGTSINYARQDHVHPAQTTVTGNAGSATRLATSRTIALSGDVTGSVSFDGTANATIAATVETNRFYTGVAPPSSPVNGDTWVNPNSGVKYEWYKADEIDTGQWVELGSFSLSGSSGSMNNLHIGPTAPVGMTGPYLWIQTGLGQSGADVAYFVEDGQP